MDTTIWLQPAPRADGKQMRILDPISGLPCPQEPAEYPRSGMRGNYYLRRLREGSMIQVDPPRNEASAAPSKSEAPARGRVRGGE